MRRKEKRLLQAVALALAALVLLPNVGLWALYRERQPDGSPGGSGAAVAPAAVQELHNRQKKTFFLGAEQRLKDWHDKEAIRRDAQRVGHGEQGKPYPMTDADRVDQAYRENGFNIYVSDKISLNRSLPDIRHPNCNSKLYLETLPNTSIIIPFHNEGWSSLLRTVHSVLNRSPPELVAEIVLVDDFSDREVSPEPCGQRAWDPVLLSVWEAMRLRVCCRGRRTEAWNKDDKPACLWHLPQQHQAVSMCLQPCDRVHMQNLHLEDEKTHMCSQK